MKVMWAWVVVVVGLAGCGSSSAGGGGGGEGPVGGKQIPDEMVCKEDSPCPNVQGTAEDYEACMSKMQPAAQDPCRLAMVEQRMCVVRNMKCTAEGDADEAASVAAWVAECSAQQARFDGCCADNPTSVFCALEH